MTKDILNDLSKCTILESKLTVAKENLFLSCMNQIDNDLDVSDDLLCIELLSGDGFCFMIDQYGVSVTYLIDMILQSPNGIVKLSEIQSKTYL